MSRVTPQNSWRWALLASGAAAAVVLSTFLFFGQPSGHDVDFHLASWMDAAQQWRHGVLFPRWAVWANYGFGEPRFIFYPPISWFLGAALGSVLPWLWTPPAFIFLSLVVAGLSMHRLVRDWMSPRGAIFAAAAYAVNPYYLVNIYLRSDFAELLASALLPLAIHYALNVKAPAPSDNTSTNDDERLSWNNAACLALVFAVIWLTNAPAAVITSYALALVLAVRAVQGRSLQPVLAGGIGLAVGLALAGVYIIPAALEQSWVNISQVITEGLRFNDNYLFTWLLDPDHNLFNFQVSCVAIFVIVLAGIGAVVSHRRVGKGQARWTQMFVLSAVSVAVMLPLSGFAWKVLPELHFVQFPWRWLFPLCVGVAYCFGEIIAVSKRWLAIAALLVVLWAACGAGVMACAFWNSDEAPDTFTAIQSGQGYEGTDEYATLKADHYDLPMGAPPVLLVSTEDTDDSNPPAKVADGSVVLQAWEPEHKVFAVDSPHPVRAAVRLLDYPAWQVRVNNQNVKAGFDSNTAQLLILLPSGHSEVDVRFARTPDRTAGGALSGFGIMLLAGMMLLGRRRAANDATV